MIEINKNYNESNLETMAKMPDCFVDLTVTSPPYDNLRTYNGYSFPFEEIAQELYRVTKQGGVVVWIVGDATVKGSETGTSFRQALFFKEIGFNIHDTMIYQKSVPPMNDKRYQHNFEYMFVFVKGKLKTFNPIMVEKKYKDNRKNKNFHRDKEGVFVNGFSKPKESLKIKENVWKIFSGGGSSDKVASKHPAIFPEQLANDHIISWSNENDLIYDCFMGSGTVAKMSILNNRNWIGSEISSEYCNIIEERIKKAWEVDTLFGDEI
jgi:DNA modification methylase